MVLLVYPGLRKPAPDIPFGLLSIGAQLKKHGISYHLLDCHANPRSWEEIRTLLTKTKYKYIGVTGISTTYAFLKEFSRITKGISDDIKVISGGALSSSIPEFILENTDVDVVVVGEGEKTFIELLSTFEENGDLDSVNGLCYKKGTSIIKTKDRELIQNLDELPLPDYDVLDMDFYTKVEVNKYLYPELTEQIEMNQMRGITFLSGRGCYGKCIFCYQPTRVVRKHSPENVVNHIKYLYEKYNVRIFNFSDELAISSKNWLKEFCELIKEHKLQIHYRVTARGNSLYEESVLILKKSGCYHVGVGFESGSQKILDILNKKVSLADYYQIHALFKKHKLSYSGSTIIGAPGETVETLRETRKFVKKLGILHSSFYMTAYPGTVLWDFAINKGYIKDVDKYLLMISNRDANDFMINYTEMKDELLFDWFDYIMGTTQFNRWRVEDWDNFIKGVLKVVYYKLKLKEFFT